jgi:hypothetical protein
MSLPSGLYLDHYRRQAKDLLKQAQLAEPEALRRIHRFHPTPQTVLAARGPRLADCQLVIARELGYPSWPKLTHDLVFRSAVAALDVGDLQSLGALLRQHATLVRYRQRVGEWYEEGYFAGATLLHHVAGNPIRCPLPPNILDVTRLLLQHGADPNAATLGGATTTELLLTSMQASEAGVAVALIDLLQAAGARDELREPDVLTAPLLNAAPATAALLVARGAAMDLRHAAGLGWLDHLGALLASETDPVRREEALLFACIRGQDEAARLLLLQGARGDVLVQPGGITPRTALHEAATRGHAGLVRLLLDHGADARVVEPHFGGTAVDWARHGGHADIAAMLAITTPRPSQDGSSRSQ